MEFCYKTLSSHKAEDQDFFQVQQPSSTVDYCVYFTRHGYTTVLTGS